MHHLDGAAGQTEGNGPQGTSSGPVDDLIELAKDEFRGGSYSIGLHHSIEQSRHALVGIDLLYRNITGSLDL